MAKATANKQPSVTKSVKALVRVNYDDTLFGPNEDAGDTFDCREEDLQQLLDVKAVEEVAADQARAQ